MSTPTAVQLHAVRFAYKGGATLLDIPAFELESGKQLLMRGPSGSGKSTLLALIAGILEPSAGLVRVAGHELTEMRRSQRDRFRADHCGVIFQQFNLLPFLSVRDNIAMGVQFSSGRATLPGGLDAEIQRLLSALGLDPLEFLRRPAGRLSVGQQQRVAAARALIGRPPVLLADEPTSALDPVSAQAFLRLLFLECRQAGTASIVVSHDASIAPLFDAQIELTSLNQAATSRQAAP